MRHYWGTSPIGSRRTKPPISTPDAGVTGAGWAGGRGRASRGGAERSEIAKSRGRTGLATPETTRRPLHPLRGAAPVTRRYTRYVAMHPIRRGALPTNRVRTQSQEQTRNPRDDHRHTPGPGSSLSLMRFCAGGNATRTRPRELAQFNEVLRGGNATRTRPREFAPGPQHTAISRRSTSRRRGRR